MWSRSRRALLICSATMILVCGLTRFARADRPEGLTGQTIKLPSGPSGIKGLGESFSANAAMGTGSYSVPLELPPGILQPSISLEYTAGKGKGALGLSFDLPLLYIYRTTDKGAPRYTEQDRFAVSGPSFNDELVLADGPTGTYRLKNDGAMALFVRNASTNTWTIRLPSGQTLYLGETAQARQNSVGRPYRWYVERHIDAFGHTIQYAYRRDQGQLFIDTIRYQLHAPTANQNVVTFSYETRPDVFSDYSSGDAITTALRMREVSMQHGSTVVRRYTLRYEEGLLSSLLSSVEMEGQNGLRMPTLTFEYLQPAYATGHFRTMRAGPSYDALLDGSATLDDVTGDGLPDLLRTRNGQYTYYENIDGLNWATTPITIPGCSGIDLNENNALLADMDGDGRRDFVFLGSDQAIRYCPSRGASYGLFRGFGPAIVVSSLEPGVHYAAPTVKMTDANSDGRTDLIYQKSGQDARLINQSNNSLISQTIPELPIDADFGDARVTMDDVNGDGTLDLLRNQITWQSSRIRVWYGTGDGNYRTEVDMTGVPTGDPLNFHLSDLNRDGQLDVLRTSGTRATYWLNDGSGRFGANQGEFENLPSQARTLKLLFADMNGNSTNDVVWLTDDGNLHYLDIVGEPFMGLLSRIDNGLGQVTDIAYRSSTAYAIDAKYAGAPWSTEMPFPVAVVSEIAVTDSLELLGLEAGISRILYDYSDGYYDGREREFRGFGRVVITEVGDAFHDTRSTETFFHLGVDPLTGADQEALKGRPRAEIIRDGQGGILSTTETAWELVWLCQEDLTGVSTRVLPACAPYADRAANKDSLVASAISTESVSGAWEGTSTPRFTAERTDYDAWLNPIRSETLGEITFSAAYVVGEGFDLSAANVGVGQDESVVETDFVVDTQDWLIGLPYETRSTDYLGALLSRERTLYDGSAYTGLTLGTADRGRISRVQAWLDRESRWIDSERYAYNADGLVSGTRDANSNLTEITYDTATRTFPVTERLTLEAGAATFSATYDTARGAVLTATDLNGRTSQWQYDGLGRLTAYLDPDSTSSLPVQRYIYTFGTSSSPISTVTTQSLIDRVAGTYTSEHTYSDGLGRTRLTKRAAEAAFGYVGSGWVRYSSRGEVSHSYDSFASSALGVEAPPPSTAVTTTYRDAQSRTVATELPATATLPAHMTETRYQPFEVLEFNERDTSTQTFLYPAVSRFDGQGRLRETEKYNDVGGTRTRLLWRIGYDALDRITSLTDPRWESGAPNRDALYGRTYGYDSLSRVREVVDPNLDSIAYEYDDQGNLTRRTDALGQRKVWTYGLANRMRRLDVSNDATGTASYSYAYNYDAAKVGGPLTSATNLLGRLAWVEYPTGEEHYSYDSGGRQVSEVRSAWDPGRSSFTAQQRDNYTQTSTYDPQGKTLRANKPGGLAVEYTYNERELLRSVTAGIGTLTSVASNITYDVTGSEVRSDFANGVRNCSRYDQRGQLTGALVGRNASVSVLTNGACSAVGTTVGIGYQHLRFAHSPEGLLTSVTDLTASNPHVPRVDASYLYDRLNELTQSTAPEGTYSFAYDDLQRITQVSTTIAGTGLTTGNYLYGERGAGPGMVTTAGTTSLDYDALGYMRQYRGYDLDFNPEGQLVRASRAGGATITYHYDAWGERKLTVVQGTSGAARVYRHVWDDYEIRNGDQIWIVEAGDGRVEIASMLGVRIDAYLLDQLTNYVATGGVGLKPLPAEYMDLDRDGDGFDSADLSVAQQGYWNDQAVGGARTVRRYYHGDQLTSTTHVTDSAGDLVSHLRYRPYGSSHDPQGLAPLSMFTGSAREAEQDLGLVRMGDRYYAPDIGRWISPDLAIGESPQRMVAAPLESNLYSYSLNNPVVHTDPSGRSVWTKLIKIGVKLIKTGNAAAAFADNVQDAATVFDSNSSTTDRVIASLSLASEFLPVSVGDIKDGIGLVKLASNKLRQADRAVDGAKRVQRVRAAERNAETAKRAIGKCPGGVCPAPQLGQCFVVGTLVSTREGLAPIESLAVGDTVLALNQVTGEVEERAIDEVIVTHDRAVLELTIGFEGGLVEALGVTGEHPFWVKNAGWVEADELLAGDELETADGRSATVQGIVESEQPATTYNLNVNGHHTYFVGDAAVWVHNTGTCRPRGRSGALKEAKRDLGIPRSQHPDATKRVKMTSRDGSSVLGPDGKPIMTREYTYKRPDGSKVVVQDHSAGHQFGEGGVGDQGPHFNVRPAENTRTGAVPGTQGHYGFER